MPTLGFRTMLAAGAVLGALMLMAAIAGGATYSSFLSVEGLVIVVGGSIANALLSFQREDVTKAFDTIRNMLKKTPASTDRLHRDIMQLVMWAYVVQQLDFLGLEKASASKIKSPLMRYGMDMVVTGYAPEKIREMMRTAAEAEFERRCVPVTVLRNMAATAPAFGMVGTLIGMVILLRNVGTDMASIEGGLAIAMLSTLYGILAARLICLPAADKLLQQEEKEHFHNHMITEGLVMLAEKQKPSYMQDRLNSFLEPSRHLNFNHFMTPDSDRRLALAS